MKTAIPLAILVLSSQMPSLAHSFQRWDFNKTGDREGWEVPADARGAVIGGAMWLTLVPKESDPHVIASTVYQAYDDTLKRNPNDPFALSPAHLAVTATQVSRVRLRVINLSNMTDFYLRWRTQDTGWGDETGEIEEQQSRCTMKAQVKEWQEVDCYIGQRWKGTIDQVALVQAQTMVHGDLWVDWIEIDDGPPARSVSKPDVVSDQVVPKILISGLSQSGFAEAFRVLDKAISTDVPFYGFNYPVITAGGYYASAGWWEMDTSSGAEAVKWVNPSLAEMQMKGFNELAAQNPDGRIDQNGTHGFRGQVSDFSQYPLYFQPAYDIAKTTSDNALRAQIYQTMRGYLDWWLSPVKRDARTGLVSAIFEETFGDVGQAPHLNPPANLNGLNGVGPAPMIVAPIDVNVLVAVGAELTANLAASLGKSEDSEHYHAVFRDLSKAINAYLWDENRGAYYNYDLHKRDLREGLNVTTFYPLRLGIAPAARRLRLLKKMLDPKQFNWGRLPLTSWAMTERGYVEAQGAYDGRSWYGDIWTIRNEAVVAGLEESGLPGLAAELNWATIKAFHGNFYEYLIPSTGHGEGTRDMTITAAQYINAVIDHLFGVAYDQRTRRISITPHIPKELFGKELALNEVILPDGDGTKISVRIRQISATAGSFTFQSTSPLPHVSVQFQLPASTKRITSAAQDVVSVRFP